MKATWEQLLNGEVDDTSFVGAALSNEPIDFTVSFAAEEPSAIEIARRRWQRAELISGNQYSERQRI